MAARPSFLRNEDWLAVVLAALIIGLVLAGVRPALPTFAWTSGAELTGRVFSPANLARSAGFGAAYLALAALGIALMRGDLRRFVLGFPLVFAVAWLALVLAGNAGVRAWGFEYVIFALAIGLLIGNLVPLPPWLRAAVQTEYYIKTGLVILGAGILFFDIVQAGALGIVQALVVVLVVWSLCWWLAQRLRVDDELSVMLATAVSICGVSAAIAACGAIQGDKKKLSYVTSLVLIVAAPMMVLMPLIARSSGMPDLVAGAWMGGTLDTSGSVVAAAALVSDLAMKTGTIVKFSQNVLIGVAAFALSVWWTMRDGKRAGEPPSARVIWDRFPKFVLGFLAASILFSFVLDREVVSATQGLLTGLRTFWLALAFVSIGLETRFVDLTSMQGGRPALAFVGAQAINVVWTLLVAFLLFGGVLFPPPAIQ